MTVKELLFSRSMSDIEEIAKYLAKAYPDYYEDTQKGQDHYIYLLSECKKAEKTNDPELRDFVINVNLFYEDDLENMVYTDESKTKIDYEKLPKYFNVDGIHLKELLEKKHTFGRTLKERRDSDELPLTTYGIDFMDRGDILNCEILELSLEKFDKNLLAAEIFWEMTFYGLENEEVEEKADEITGNCDEAMKIYEETKDNPEEYEKHFKSIDDLDIFKDIPPLTEEEKKYMNDVAEYNVKVSDDFFLEYIKKYGNTQIARLTNEEIVER